VLTALFAMPPAGFACAAAACCLRLGCTGNWCLQFLPAIGISMNYGAFRANSNAGTEADLPAFLLPSLSGALVLCQGG
jgi:hypothetical protein